MPKSSYISNYKSLGISSSTTALSKDEAQETISPEDPTNPASSFLTGSPSTTPTQQTWFEQSHNPLGIQAPQPHPVSRSSINPEVEMSAIGISKFEPNFEPPYDGGVQQSFAWPRGFDMGAGEQFLSQGQMSPPLAPASLAGFDQQQPLYARALTNSPPRTDLTPEQRELKRQRDVARRDTKVRMRRDRSTSNPYTVSPRPSPELLSRSLSDYSNTLAPSPLLSQSSQGSPELSTISAMSSPAYLSSYTPQLSDSGSSDLYGGVFSMPPQSFDQVPAYAMPYSTGPMDASLGAFIPRPQAHSMSSSDSSMLQSLYQNPSPKMGSLDPADHVRVVHSRPKPQCWEHGCNGRQFSTFSNLLRHQREKSGAASKSVCPNCGAEFTRTTARNGHMAHEKCKQKRQS